MRKVCVLTVLLVPILIAGCSPQSDNLVKKQNLAAPLPTNQAASVPSRSLLEDESQVDLATQSIIKGYGSTIRRYSEQYGFDWRLILAVMKQESRFLHDAVSHKGASGLMQIMPATGEEVARKLEIENVAHPANNIRGGIFYLKRLYNLFEGVEESDRIKLALAAYNAGIGRVYDAQELAAYLHENPAQWQSIRDALPLLSKRYYTLHKNVWPESKPRSGWFGSSSETIAYVERIMGYYEEYQQVLN